MNSATSAAASCRIAAFEMVEDEAEDAEAEDYTVLRYVVEPGWARPSTSR
jgi:hypothetical protein